MLDDYLLSYSRSCIDDVTLSLFVFVTHCHSLLFLFSFSFLLPLLLFLQLSGRFLFLSGAYNPYVRDMPIPPTKLSFNYLLDPKGMSYGRYDIFLSSLHPSNFLLYFPTFFVSLSLSLSLLLYLFIFHIHFLSIVFPSMNVFNVSIHYIFVHLLLIVSSCCQTSIFFLLPLTAGDTMFCTMSRQTVWQ